MSDEDHLRRSVALGVRYFLVATVMSACGSGKLSGDGGDVTNTGGGGGVRDGGTGGQGGLALGCVDVVLPLLPGDFGADGGGVPFNGGVWRTQSGLHVGWKAYRSVSIAGAVVARSWLFVATLDPENGALRKVRRYDVFPAGTTSDQSNIRGLSGSESEIFATSLRSFDAAANQSRNQTLLLGRLDDDFFRMDVDLGVPSSTYDITDIGWDGEAFAVHLQLPSTREIFVARVAPDGQVILPLTKYGATPSGGGMPLGYRMSTNATSGMSYLFDASGGRFLSGHDRAGQAVPWAATRPLDIMLPNGLSTVTSNPGVAADAEGGAWVAWTQTSLSGLAAHVTGAGAVDQSVILRANRALARMSPAIVAASSTQVWVAGSTGDEAITVYEFDGAALREPRPLVSSPFAPNDPVNVWDTRDYYSFDWQDERWLSFSEPALLHIVKVHGDCTYRAATKAAAQ